jgi:hypothetical protein
MVGRPIIEEVKRWVIFLGLMQRIDFGNLDIWLVHISLLCHAIQMYRIVFLLTGLLVVAGCVPATTTYYAQAPIVTTGYVYQQPYYYGSYYYNRPYYGYNSYYRNNHYRNHNHNNYQRNRSHNYYRWVWFSCGVLIVVLAFSKNVRIASRLFLHCMLFWYNVTINLATCVSVRVVVSGKVLTTSQLYIPSSGVTKTFCGDLIIKDWLPQPTNNNNDKIITYLILYYLEF